MAVTAAAASRVRAAAVIVIVVDDLRSADLRIGGCFLFACSVGPFE